MASGKSTTVPSSSKRRLLIYLNLKAKAAKDLLLFPTSQLPSHAYAATFLADDVYTS
ncbi:Uncharacterized protein APZ42_021721 [Daphnia magna]|uniref:Uncharacterized protein n=1 Tax=Daphnia magna TaxID=35525 RepID=A0A162C9X3_9CRUS|nr:Uncharacterized protein APZ42_021721 [Daphnia magna]